MIEVPGTELQEIIDESDRFGALVERELHSVVRSVTASLGEVIVAQGMPAAVSPDDLNMLLSLWRERVTQSMLPRLAAIVRAGIASQLAGINAALGTTVISAFDESMLTSIILASAENRLVGIGDNLWNAAREALAEAVANGESIPDIARRIRDAADVAAPRATTIARTEVIGAANKSSIEMMRAAGLVTDKRWLATFDSRVRLSHIAAHGQVVDIDDPFQVGASTLDHPGDPHGTPEEIINCRCAMGYVVDEDASSALTAAARVHDGAMIALVPSEEDQKRLAVEDGEFAEQLHMTMYFLGDASNWSKKQRKALINALSTYDWDHEGDTGALMCRAFGLAHWNPFGENPCWVLNVGGDDISDVRSVIGDQLSRLNGEVPLPEMPAQHRPFSAHVCMTYTSDTSPELIEQLKERMGDVVFDRVRVAFAGESVDIPLRDTLSTKASATLATTEVTVDWYIEKGHEECTDERPWAVVKMVDGSVEGCHETREDATAQLRALLEAQARKRDEDLEKEIDEELTAIQAAAEATADSQALQSECPPGQAPDADGNCAWGAGLMFFEGVAIVEGEWTGDGRQFAPDSLTWTNLDEVTVPLQWQKETNHGGINDVTVNVGRLTELERSGSEIRVKGYIDTGSEDGAEVVRRLGTGTLGGVSIVADDPEQAEVEFVYPEGCEELDDKTSEEIDQEVSLEEIEKCFWPIGMIFHSGRIRALTLVDTAAFVEASIHLVKGEATENVGDDTSVVVSEEFGTVNTGDYKVLSKLDMSDPQSVAQFIDEIEDLLAAGYSITIPDLPPAEWFDEPTELPPFGALTVTDEGRVYGLLAPRDVAHRSFRDKRITVPMGNVDYSRWMNRETIVQGGQRIATGPITMECGHASTDGRVTSQSAMQHYEDACSVVATARVGESKDGVWIAGALVPGVTHTQVVRMLACAISGDWRGHRERPGTRELAGALLVPVPGFPVAGRANLRLEEGQLVASTIPVAWKITGDVSSESEVDNDNDNGGNDSDDAVVLDNEVSNTVEPTESEVDHVALEVDDLPTWDDVVKRQEIRAQTREIAARLERELGIEIGV